jgi:spore coat protein U-like protein
MNSAFDRQEKIGREFERNVSICNMSQQKSEYECNFICICMNVVNLSFYNVELLNFVANGRISLQNIKIKCTFAFSVKTHEPFM